MRSSSGARPTSARAREALFSRLQSRIADPISASAVGTSFLDLFCAGGTVGIEALSRGAATVAFVDHQAAALRILESNLEDLGVLSGEANVLLRRLDLPRGLAKLPNDCGWPERFDVIFADPPYAFRDYDDLLVRCADRLDDDGLLIVEHDARFELAAVAGLGVLDSRRYGDSAMTTLGLD